jgi:cytochrome P450
MIAAWETARPDILVDNGDGTRTVELGRAFANEFPIRVVCQVLGFPDEASDAFFYWYNSMMSGLGGSESHQKGLEARQHLEDYVEGIVEQRRVKPTYLYDEAGNPRGKDILSKLCESQSAATSSRRRS